MVPTLDVVYVGKPVPALFHAIQFDEPLVRLNAAPPTEDVNAPENVPVVEAMPPFAVNAPEKVGAAVTATEGVAPVVTVTFDPAVNPVTGVVTRAAFGMVPDVSPAPEPLN